MGTTRSTPGTRRRHAYRVVRARPTTRTSTGTRRISLDRVDWLMPSTCASAVALEDRKSTRLNSSHSQISYAVFCLKKKKKQLKDSCRTTDEKLNRNYSYVIKTS